MEHKGKYTLKDLFDRLKRHLIAVAIVIAAAVAGAGAGVIAYYNGWLG